MMQLKNNSSKQAYIQPEFRIYAIEFHVIEAPLINPKPIQNLLQNHTFTLWGYSFCVIDNLDLN